jgi:ferritin-like metal-binding protein YciE
MLTKEQERCKVLITVEELDSLRAHIREQEKRIEQLEDVFERVNLIQTSARDESVFRHALNEIEALVHTILDAK